MLVKNILSGLHGFLESRFLPRRSGVIWLSMVVHWQFVAESVAVFAL